MSGLAIWAAPPPRPDRPAPRFRSAAHTVRRALGLARPTTAVPSAGLVGRPVVDGAWARVGTVHDLVVETGTGRALGAVIAHLGPLGEPVLSVAPWSALRVGTACARVVVLPHVATASQRAEALGGLDDDRYRRFVAAAAAELARSDRRPWLHPALGGAAVAVALAVLAPDAVAAGVLAVAGLALGVLVGRQTTVEVLSLGDPDAPPARPAPPRVVDADFELVGEAAPAPPARAEGRPVVAEERRIRTLRVLPAGPADGGRVGALDLRPVGGRVVGVWRGDCYVPDPAPADRLAGGDLVAVALWLDPAGGALAHLHRLGLRAA